MWTYNTGKCFEVIVEAVMDSLEEANFLDYYSGQISHIFMSILASYQFLI